MLTSILRYNNKIVINFPKFKYYKNELLRFIRGISVNFTTAPQQLSLAPNAKIFIYFLPIIPASVVITESVYEAPIWFGA